MFGFGNDPYFVEEEIIREEIIEEEVFGGRPDGLGRRRPGASGFRPGYGGVLGIDNNGDLVENFGNGFGVDLETGNLEVEVFPGFDIEL